MSVETTLVVLLTLLYIVVPLGSAIGVILSYEFTASRTMGVDLFGRMGGASWNFKDSWASTLTAAGAILGTILSAGLVKEDLVKNNFTLINLFFGAMIIVAVLLYNATRSEVPISGTVSEEPNKSQEQPGAGTQYKGWVWAFLLACWLILWATLGQLLTLFALLFYITDMSLPLHAAFIILLGLSAILVVLYVIRSVPWTLKNQLGQDEREGKQGLEEQRLRPNAALP